MPKSALVQHAERELKLAGLFDKDSDYGGMLGKAVMRLVKTFAKEGHSNMSAQMAVSIFNRVITFKTLTPISADPKEWVLLDINLRPDKDSKCWQNLRDFSLFSDDGGKTYWCVEDKRKRGKFPRYKAEAK